MGETPSFWKTLGFTVTVEGKARLLVPRMELYLRPDGQPEPAWAPVFYNPVMRDNRSLTVAGLRAYSGWKIRYFADPLAGACPRAVRALLETGVDQAYASDIDGLAVAVCRENKRLNGLGSELVVEKNDANAFMYRLDYESTPVDAVDLDPYGSPVYYVQAAARLIAKKGLLIATATDLGPLEGKYPTVALRRYGSLVHRTSFSKEVAARVLVWGIARLLTPLDRGVRPLLTYYDRHYIKLILEVVHSKSMATQTASQAGYLCIDSSQLPQGYWHLEETLTRREGEACWRTLGPLWIGSLWDPGFIEKLTIEATGGGLDLSSHAQRMLRMMREESRVQAPYYYRLDLLHAIAGKGEMRSPQLVVEELRARGFGASRTHFDPRGIRTNAGLQDILESLS